MKSLSEIKLILNNHKDILFNEYPIKTLAIFGYYAMKEQNDKSDVDIIVEFHGKVGIRFIDLADEIEKLLGVRVDLISKKGIKDKYYQAIRSDLVYV